MSVPKLFPIEMSTEKKRKTLLTNIIKMLMNRDKIDRLKVETSIDKIIPPLSYLDEYDIPTNTGIVKVKLFPHKITTISKNTDVYTFMKKNEAFQVIVVVSEYSTKRVQKDIQMFKNAEIFLQDELMINIVDHEIVPLHRKLNDEEKEEFKQRYKVKKIPRMLFNDPVARYYNAKVGDICKITRASELSGEVITYRYVVPGELK